MRALAARGATFTVGHEDETLLELVLNGLAFDLTGLGADAPARLPRLAHRFGLEDIDLREAHPVAIVPGPHLVGGEAMPPIVRSQLTLALQLAKLRNLVALAWLPARSCMSVDYFTAVVPDWLRGGAFPALGLTAVAPSLDGGLQSEGLAFFTGQELRIEPELAEDRAAAFALAVQLIRELVEHGPIADTLRKPGPAGAELMLEPSANGKFVRVRAVP